MTDLEIYRLWQTKFIDKRYLRYRRWLEIKSVISKHKVKNVLEFGSGISTLLFLNNSCTVTSYETDLAYLGYVKDLIPKGARVKFVEWDNRFIDLHSLHFDLGLVDGALPRIQQLHTAIKHCRIVVVDDVIERVLRRKPYKILEKFERLDTGKSYIGIFKIE